MSIGIHNDFDTDLLMENAFESRVAGNDDISAYESDKDFMDECYNDCLPTMAQMMITEDNGDAMDEAVVNATARIKSYLVGQGMLSEAAGVPTITNKKINVVHLSKDAQIRRLKTIIILKMGRKANSKAYRKYKMGQKIKKENRQVMENLYGAKAEMLAKKMYMKLQHSKKPVAVVEEEKKNVAQAAEKKSAKK